MIFKYYGGSKIGIVVINFFGISEQKYVFIWECGEVFQLKEDRIIYIILNMQRKNLRGQREGYMLGIYGKSVLMEIIGQFWQLSRGVYFLYQRKYTLFLKIRRLGSYKSRISFLYIIYVENLLN